MRFIIIVQLSKIFHDNENQKRNLNKLFNRLKNEGYDTPFEELLASNKLSSNLITSKKQLLETINVHEELIRKQAETIEALVEARDCLYAHTDPDCEVKLPSWQSMEDLVALASKCFNDINYGLFGKQVLFDKTDDWDVSPIVKHLSHYLDIRKENQKTDP